MADFTKVMTNFTGGKVSERYRGRFDLPFYQNSLEEFKNFLQGKIGGAYKRTGTEVCRAIQLSEFFDGTAIPFDSGRGSSYVVMMPDTAVSTNDVYSVNLPSITAIKIDSSFTFFNLGSGITGNPPPAPQPAWSKPSGLLEGNWIYQQVGDVLFITHSSGKQRPLALVRTSDDTFELNYYDTYVTDSENLSYVLRPPYAPRNISAITFAVAAGSPDSAGRATGTITASADYFTASMAGSLIKIVSGSTENVMVITGYTNATTVSVTYYVGSGTTAATDNWAISAWNNEFGWPTSVTYHNQRLYWGGNVKYYDTTWGSLVGNLFHMMRERLLQDSSSDSSGINYFGDINIASDPLDFKPASTYGNSTTWLSGGRVLMVGTTGGENIVNIGVDSISSVENSNYGSSFCNVVKAGKDVVFIGKDRRTLRTYRFSDENGSWLSDDLSSKAEDLFSTEEIGSGTKKTIVQISWNPDTKRLWVLLSDGNIAVISYDPEYGMAGWSEIEIGGAALKEITGVVHLPNDDRTSFDTYLVVKRTSSPGNTAYLEKIRDGFNNNTMVAFSSSNTEDYPRYLDFINHATADGSGVVTGEPAGYRGLAFDVIVMTSTQTYLVEGVDCITDGASGSELDFTFPANAKVMYGYKYTAELKILPLDAGGVLGSAISDLKDISRTYLKLYKSKSFSIGSKDQNSGLDLHFEVVSYDDIVTKEEEKHIFDSPDSEEQVIIRSIAGEPLNVMALIMKGDSKR